MDSSCQLHGSHTPRPLRWVDHHILPLAMGGKNEPSNKIKTCDTGHYNVHRILDELLTQDAEFLKDPSLPEPELPRWGGREERKIALSGYDQWVAAHRPGSPVFQDHFVGMEHTGYPAWGDEEFLEEESVG